MTWKKYFTEVPTSKHLEMWMQKGNKDSGGGAKTTKFSSWLPEVYEGAPDRQERYMQFNDMDTDPQINAALDTISDFCTTTEEESGMQFDIDFFDDASETEVDILKKSLRRWIKMNQFETRLWRVFRSAIKYGDQFFIRDPQTYKWIWVDPADVEKVVVNEAQGKKPEEYHIRNLDLNLQTLTASSQQNNKSRGTPAGVPLSPNGSPLVGPAYGNSSNEDSVPIDASHVIHLSLTEGLDGNWPFGISILEGVFKPYKQKTLLEDAILIYRVHRAPERRVFYIDTGDMPPNRAMTYVERVKNEIHQRRIPTKNGGGKNIMDATYNPLSTTEDYFFAQGADGRGSRVETLPGGDATGNIEDLKYFNELLLFGLRVPRSYLPSTGEGQSTVYSDGRATTALIEENRFNNYCERLQGLMNPLIDKEFKLFLKRKGVNIDSTMFSVRLNTPQNFAKYRQAEIDSVQLNVFAQASEIPYVSKRFAMKRWLGLSEDDIVENEKMWKEENLDTGSDDMSSDSQDDLKSLGMRPEAGGDLGLGDDLDDSLGDMDEEPGSLSPVAGQMNASQGVSPENI